MMSRLWALAAVGLVAAGLASASAAPVEPCEAVPVPPDVRVEYYEIRGATVAELRAQMAALNPRNDGGVPHDAHAEWHVDWRYPFQRSPQGCATGPSTVTVRTTYTLPRWHDEALGPLDVQRRWTCFFSAILVHEDGHRLHGQEAAAQVRALLPTLPPQPTCPEMDALANAEARKVLQHFREVDEEYDRNTRHGATQGALLR